MNNQSIQPESKTMNFKIISIKKRPDMLFLFFCFALLPSFISAQTNPQGFFLDSWVPKNIEIKDYESIEQTTLSSTVTVNIDAGTTLSKVSKYVYGHNAAAWGGKLNESTQAVKDINALAPNIIRWPGGSMSNDHFWKATSQATCPKDLPPTYVYKDLLYGSNNNGWTMSVDNFYSLLAKTNSVGSICVNYSYARIGTSADPVLAAAKYAADWVRYDNGRTRYWEIGNENFGSWEVGYTIDQTLNKDGQPKTISGDLYGKHCKVFIEEMRKAAKEVGNDIKIGVVAMDSHVTYNAVQMNWNSGMMKQVGNLADYMIVHSYHTPYDENSTVSTILNSYTRSKDIKQYVTTGLKTSINHDPLPMALTEWNIFAVGSKQGVSYINGIHGALVLGELIKNQYGDGIRWDLVNGWSNGDNHAILADGEPGIARYTPRAPFYYMYYFQKFFGDKFIQSTVTGSTDVVSYASKFSSGQSGIVLVNKGTSEKVVSLKMNNFKTGDRYYYYLLTGGTDNGDFSRKVVVNGKTTTAEGGGPADYATLKPFGTSISADIKLSLPKYSTVYVVVESDKNLQTQTIQFDPIPSKAVGDTDFSISASASSGLPVQFASSNPKVAKVTNNTVQIIGAGTCDIIAFQDGDLTYNPAGQLSRSLTVAKGNQTIAFPPLQPKINGDPDFLPGASASSGLACAYTSSNPAVAAIVNGQIQIKGAGSATITAKQSGNINYNAAPEVSQELIVAVKTAVEQLSINNDFEIFPNPATDLITIKLNTENSGISIYNSWGSLVYSNAVSASVITIPVSQIGGIGVYFVQVNSTTKKLIVIQ
jgi:hypothetical protein